MSKKKSLKQLIIDFNIIHNNKYDYSLITEENYENSQTIISIICPIHGIFKQLSSNHRQGKDCYKCSIIRRAKKRTKPLEQVKRDLEKIHNLKYDYSLITKENYENVKSKVPIICHELDKDGKEHGVFYQNVNTHHNGCGCPKCKTKKLATERRKPINNLIKDFQLIHGNRYDYSLINDENYKNCDDKVPIICSDHGVFNQNVSSHLYGCGCSKCRLSDGIIKIIEWLNKNNILFIQEHKFKDCRDKQLLPFDFYLPKYNLCIEYDGGQHFYPVCFGGMSWERAIIKFEDRLEKDIIKNKFCFKNSIGLIRIPFWDEDKISQILSKQLLR